MINSIANDSQPLFSLLEKSDESRSTGGFGRTLSNMVNQINETQLAGDQAIEKLQSGKAEHLHEVMIAVEEADISLRMAVQIRNKALTAYEEIMRMQI